MLDCVGRHSPGSESFEVLRPFSLPMRRGITAVRGCTDPRVLRDLELYWVLAHCNSGRVDLYFPCFFRFMCAVWCHTVVDSWLAYLHYVFLSV